MQLHAYSVDDLNDSFRCITDHSTALRSRHPVLRNSMVGVGTNPGNFIRKLREYTLNPGHLAGGNKARVFASCLGIDQQDVELLRSLCLRRAILSK